MKNEKARIEWIDLVRAVAILLVVLCHSTESIYQLNLEYMTAVPFLSRVCGFACFTAGRLGVPLFLMITGSLLLSRDYDSDSIKYFWKKKWLPLANQFSLGFSGTYYGIYILYGYFISTGTFKKIPPLCIVIISLLAFVSVVFIQNWSYENGLVYNVWYNDLLILAASMGIFELASRIKHVYGYKVIREISKYSFAVYLTHNIFRMVLADSVNALAVGRMLKTALLWAVCSAAGFVLSVLISKIPKLGKYILYMK